MQVISLKEQEKGIKPDNIDDKNVCQNLASAIVNILQSIFGIKDKQVDYLRSDDRYIVCYKGNRLMSIAFKSNELRGLNIRYDYWKVPIIKCINELEKKHKIEFKYFKTDEYI